MAEVNFPHLSYNCFPFFYFVMAHSQYVFIDTKMHNSCSCWLSRKRLGQQLLKFNLEVVSLLEYKSFFENLVNDHEGILTENSVYVLRSIS